MRPISKVTEPNETRRPIPESLTQVKNFCDGLLPSLLGIFNLLNYPAQFRPGEPAFHKILSKNVKHLMTQVQNVNELHNAYTGQRALTPTSIAMANLLDGAARSATDWSFKDSIEWIISIPPNAQRWVSLDVPFFLPHLTTLFERLIILSDHQQLVLRVKLLEESDTSLRFQIQISCAGEKMNHPSADKPGDCIRNYKHFESSFEFLQTFLNLWDGWATLGQIQTDSDWVNMVFTMPKAHPPTEAFHWPTTLVKPTILLVDDNTERITAAEQALHGFELTQCRSFFLAEMLETAEQIRKPYDVVLVDHDLQTLPTDALAHTQRITDEHETFVGILARRPTLSDYNMFRSFGAHTVFPKPITSSTLPNLLHHHWTLFQDCRHEPHRKFKPLPTGIQILLVENHLPSQFVIESVLLELGYEVTTAESGFEGVELCKKNQYDFIFMDIGMSGMDGFDTTRAIRSDKKSINLNTPVMALTAYHYYPHEGENKLHSSGLNGVLVKPAAIEHMQDAIKKWLPDNKKKLLKETDFFRNLVSN